MRTITASELKSLRRCAREHSYRYLQLRRPSETANALRFGTLVHAALEAWWLSDGDRLASALAELALCDADPYDRVKAEELMLGYHVRWADADLECLAVEAEFRAPIVNPATGAASRTFELGGKVDAIVRQRSTGRVLILEHKTSSEDIGVGSAYWKRLQLDGQVSTYYVGARSLGHDVAGCIYDVIRKTSIRPALATPVESRKYTRAGALYASQRETDESPEEYRARLRADIAADPDRYYQRGEVVRLEEEERDAAFDVWSLTRQLREAELAGRYPRNPDACVQYGRACDYWPVCSRETTLDDPSRYRSAGRAHEELTEAPKEEAAE